MNAIGTPQAAPAIVFERCCLFCSYYWRDLPRLATCRECTKSAPVVPAEGSCLSGRSGSTMDRSNGGDGEVETGGNERLVLTVRQAADALGVSDDLVYELTARGEIPCLRLGRRRVIPRRAIELMLEQAMRETGGASA
jgi:excisionase family DNA binding protein